MVDLAWLRSTPWRERVASTFDPPQWREELGRISSVTVSHAPQSGVAGLLFCGWLAARLGWEPGSLVARGRLAARQGARAPAGRRGQAGDRPDDVRARAGQRRARHGERHEHRPQPRPRRPERHAAATPKGSESTWTVLGASRGEAGILGEGIRQALLRDPVYRECAGAGRGDGALRAQAAIGSSSMRSS